MKTLLKTTCRAAALTMLAVLTLAGTPARAAESLGDVLRQSGWDRIIGTWIDADTKGAKMEIDYAWKFKDRVIEIKTRAGDKESVALLGRNPKTGKVFNAAADNQGGSSIGEWTLEDGQVVLRLAFVTGAGVEGTLKIMQRLEDKDTLIVTVELPEPVTFKMVRKTNQTEGRPGRPPQ